MSSQETLQCERLKQSHVINQHFRNNQDFVHKTTEDFTIQENSDSISVKKKRIERKKRRKSSLNFFLKLPSFVLHYLLQKIPV